MSLSYLQNIGLTDSESSLYELSLKLGEVPVSELIKQSKRKRPTVYKALQSLEKKGLIIQRDIHKKIHVRPESPTKLQEIADRESQRIEQTKKSLLAQLPALSLSYMHSTEKPVVRIYEGVDGLKKIYEDTLVVGEPVSALLQAATVDPALYKWLTTTYVRKRARKRIHAKVIVASSNLSREYMEKSKEEYRTTKLIDAKRFPFQHEINIYGDKVAIIHYKKDEPLIGIVIQHPQIAMTMQAWFDLAWDHQS